MPEINNPISYYETVPFFSMDSVVYTAALIGMVGGLVGTVQAFRFKYKATEYLPYIALLGASGWAAMDGLTIASAHYTPGGASASE